MMTRTSFLRTSFCAVLLAALAPTPASAQDWSWADGQNVQAVEWKGLKLLNEMDADAMISTREGEPFDSHTLADDIARLYRSGRFGSGPAGGAPVSVVVQQSDDEGSVRVVFTVHEPAKHKDNSKHQKTTTPSTAGENVQAHTATLDLENSAFNEDTDDESEG